jgi:hypothetical protein
LPSAAAHGISRSGLAVCPARSVNVIPPSVDTCHRRVGVGAPVAAASNQAKSPAGVLVSAGWPRISGGVGTRPAAPPAAAGAPSTTSATLVSANDRPGPTRARPVPHIGVPSDHRVTTDSDMILP